MVPTGPAAATTAAPAQGAAEAAIGPFTLEQLDAVAAATRARLAAASLGDVTRLVLHLNPAELGPVRITAEQTAAGVTIDLAGGDESTRETLRAALGDLRQQLDLGGQQRDPGRDAGRWGGEGHGHRDASRESRTAAVHAATPHTPAAAPLSGLRGGPGARTGIDIRA